MFQIYKPGQGKIVRLSMAFLIEAMIIFGCYQLFIWMNFTGVKGNPRWITKQFIYSEGLEMEITPRLIIAIGSFILFSLSNYFLCNSGKFSDFLIDVHTELTKVSWPSRDEVVKSTIVVVIVTFIFMGYIFLIDNIFTWIVSLVL